MRPHEPVGGYNLTYPFIFPIVCDILGLGQLR